MTKKDCYKCDIEPCSFCGECPIWLADEEASEKERIAYKQGKADGIDIYIALFREWQQMWQNLKTRWKR